MAISEDHFPDIPPMDYVAYERGEDVIADSGTDVLSHIVNPYFNRSYDKFCSHRQTPPDGITTGLAAITMKDGVAYAANPLFTDYAINRCMAYRDIIEKLIGDLGVKPIVEARLPSFTEVTVRDKGDSTIVHLLSYVIERKCRGLDTIEESIPLYDKRMYVRTRKRPVRVTLVPAMTDLEFEYDGEGVRFTIQEMKGHEMIEIAMA
jgi:hypothetical protein